MATLSVPGIGSGLDIESIVSQLMALEQRPLQVLQQKQAGYLAQISAYGQLRSAVATFQDAVEDLKSLSDFSVYGATSSDESVFTASADDQASAGSYTILVEGLAAAQKMGSAAVADADSTQIGNAGDELTITVAGSSFGVEIGGMTLSEIQQAINEAADNVGVSAGIVHVGADDYRLRLESEESGTDQVMTLSFADSDGAPIADPLGLTEIQAAADAAVLVDGVYSITRTSNSIADAIPGVTLELQNSSEQTQTLVVGRDLSAITDSVQGLVDAYNELLGKLLELGTGELQGDSTLRLLQSQIYSVLGSSVDVGGGFSYLAEIGVTFQRDGSLALDASALADALEADLQSVETLMADEDAGVANRLYELLDEMLSTEGLIDARNDGLNARVDAADDQMVAMERRLGLIEQRYRSQFASLDTLLGQLQTTSNYLTQQLEGLQNLQKQIVGSRQK